jgi:unspecific monooxygenase
MSFTPPALAAPPGQLSSLQFLKAVRTNVLQIWPEQAYDEEAVVQRSFGRTRMLLSAPEAIHHVLLANAANYRRSPASIRVLRPILGEGLLLSEGEEWKRQRRTVAPALAPRMMPVLSRHIAAGAAEAVAGLRAEAAGGAAVDLLDAMYKLALEVAARSIFSLEMGEHGAAMRRLLERYAATLARPRLLDMFLPPSVLTPHDYARRRFQREWRTFMDGLIRRRLAEPEPEQPRDLFDMLRAARDPEEGAAFDAAALRDQTATMIVAGHETTAATMFWALYLLASDPDAQAWVAEEAAEADLLPAGAFAALPGLVRTRAVVQETLRIYPAAFTMVRQAIGPDRAGSIDVPAGAVVFISPWVLHRHRLLWEEPARFKPDRFIDFTPPRYTFLPFGAGPRVCVGAQFALTEATIMLAAMVQAFSVSLSAGGRPVLPRAVLTTQPDHAPSFRIAARPRRLPLAA